MQFVTRATIVLLICSTLSAYAAKETPKVSVDKLTKTSLEKKLFFPVQIQSKVHSEILADAQYIVIKKLVNLGQKVKKGDPLLVLRNQDLSVHYEKRILKSPVSGVVAGIKVLDGQFVGRNESLILINDPSQLIGKIEVSAIDYKKLKVGLKTKININSLNLKGVPATVQGIGAAVDGLTGTISVELKIKDDKVSELIPGVIGLAEITLNKEELALVKEKSLYYIGEDIFVATLDKNKVKKVKVKLGKRHKDKIEILSGLDVGSTYISESAKFLRDNEVVEVNKSKSGTKKQ